MLNYGIQMYGCTKEYNADPEGVIARFAKAGYTEVEPCVSFADGPSGYGWQANNLTDHIALVKKYGMTITSAHGSAAGEEGLKKMVAAAKELGLKAYVVGFRGPFEREALEVFAKNTLALAEELAKEGIELWLHNNAAEIRSELDGVSYYEWVLDYCGGKLGAQVDTGWVECGGRNLQQFIQRNAKYIRSIHHKDVKALPLQEERPINVAIGDGVVDSKYAFTYAKEHGLGQIVDQDFSEVDLLADLEAGLAFLQGLE